MHRIFGISRAGGVHQHHHATQTPPPRMGVELYYGAASGSNDATRQGGEITPAGPSSAVDLSQHVIEMGSQPNTLPGPSAAAAAPTQRTLAERVALARKAVRDDNPHAPALWRPIVQACKQGSASWREVFDTRDETGVTALQEMLSKNAYRCLNVVVGLLPMGVDWADGTLAKGCLGLYTMRDGNIEGPGFEFLEHTRSSFYSGEFKDGFFHGKGVETRDFGRYEGDWREGRKFGWGKQHRTNNSQVSEGVFMDDKFLGNPRVHIG